MSGWPTDGQLNEQQFLALVQRQKSLNFRPGDEFLYSNTGYVLLSIVVKRASGKSLRDFAAERIFKPLGMTQTEFRDDHTSLIPRRALGYQPDGSTYRISQPEFDVVGDGGAYSTIVDLAKWDANFQSGRVGGKRAIAMLQTPGTLNDGQPIPYALAVTTGEFHGLTTFSHGGSYGGYRSMTAASSRQASVGDHALQYVRCADTLAEQVSSVVLGFAAETDGDGGDGPVAGQLWTSGAAQAPYDSSSVKRRADQLARIAGTYYSGELELPVTIMARDSALVLQRPQAAEIRFSPVTDELFTNSDKMLLKVVRDDHGAVTGFTLTINRVRDLEFVRR